jgi:hypothetical protein
MIDKKIISTAFHEAGHAITAHIVGWSINFIHIETKNSKLLKGVTNYDFIGQDNGFIEEFGCHRRIYCLIGGPVAHAIHDQRSEITDEYLSADGKAVDQINKTLSQNGIEPISIHETINDLAPLYRTVKYWNAITEVAESILNNDNLYIEKSEFEAIVNKHNLIILKFE